MPSPQSHESPGPPSVTELLSRSDRYELLLGIGEAFVCAEVSASLSLPPADIDPDLQRRVRAELFRDVSIEDRAKIRASAQATADTLAAEEAHAPQHMSELCLLAKGVFEASEALKERVRLELESPTIDDPVMKTAVLKQLFDQPSD